MEMISSEVLPEKSRPNRDDVEPNARSASEDISNFSGIPVVSWAKAGESVDYEDLCSQIDEWVQFDTKDPNAFALIIEGDSMEPRFPAGDYIIVEPNRMPRNGGYVAVKLRENGGVMFKKYRTTGPEGGVIVLESENPNYSPKEYKGEDFEWIYAVGGMYRRF